MEENLNNGNNINTEDNQNRFKFKIIILVILISVIIIILIIFLSLLLTRENFDECEEGEEEKCSKCENNKCISCNPQYRLIDGICKATFSFRAIYKTEDYSENIFFIEPKFKDRIISMNIDGKVEVEPYLNYTFLSPGNHIV